MSNPFYWPVYWSKVIMNSIEGNIEGKWVQSEMGVLIYKRVIQIIGETLLSLKVSIIITQSNSIRTNSRLYWTYFLGSVEFVISELGYE